MRESLLQESVKGFPFLPTIPSLFKIEDIFLLPKPAAHSSYIRRLILASSSSITMLLSGILIVYDLSSSHLRQMQYGGGESEGRVEKAGRRYEHRSALYYGYIALFSDQSAGKMVPAPFLNHKHRF